MISYPKRHAFITELKVLITGERHAYRLEYVDEREDGRLHALMMVDMRCHGSDWIAVERLPNGGLVAKASGSRCNLMPTIILSAVEFAFHLKSMWAADGREYADRESLKNAWRVVRGAVREVVPCDET